MSKWIGTREAARVLHVCEPTVRKLVKQNRIPYYQVSEKGVRFDKAELLQSVKRGPQQEKAEK
jgi:excisionase family DNA binding protein